MLLKWGPRDQRYLDSSIVLPKMKSIPPSQYPGIQTSNGLSSLFKKGCLPKVKHFVSGSYPKQSSVLYDQFYAPLPSISLVEL